ncbi:MAG TPA: DUF2190 family protein [Sphingomicrobium sp.]|jgi:predicted RecA/RadA family phage recombinase|nr:DUF2190 family protein [Sphingomicrobium sp.]
MRNYVAPGEALDLTAPSGGVVGGNAYKIGSAIVIAASDAAEGAPFVGYMEGVYDVEAATHASDQAWTEGMLVYWDDSAKKFTKTSTSNTKAGVAAAAKTSTAAGGRIRLVPSI